MMDSINIVEQDELCFSLREDDTMQLCYNEGAFYILTEDHYFVINDISDFKQIDEIYFMFTDGEDSCNFSKEEYDMIYDLMIRCKAGEFND